MKKRKALVVKNEKYKEKIQVKGTFDDFFNIVKTQRDKKIQQVLSENEKKA